MCATCLGAVKAGPMAAAIAHPAATPGCSPNLRQQIAELPS